MVGIIDLSFCALIVARRLFSASRDFFFSSDSGGFFSILVVGYFISAK